MLRLPLIGRLRFWQILSFIFSTVILVYGISTSIVVTRISNEGLYERIINEGKQLTSALSNQSKLALLYDSEASSKEVEEFFLAFTDIRAIRILRPDLTTLYQSEFDWTLAGAGAMDRQHTSLIFENEDVLKYSSPVYAGADGDGTSPYDDAGQQELIGYVLLVQSKDSLRQISGNILQTNVVLCLGFAFFLLLLLLYWTARLTRPLQELAATMQLSRSGALTPRITPHGARDIVEMQHAFNNMMDRLDARETELKKARDEAFELAKVKSDFAANVSHELRTPLNGILGMLELLDTNGLDAEQVKYVNLARESAQNLLVLINNVLDFSRTEAGSMELNVREFDLEEQIVGVINLLGMQAQKKGIDLVYQIEPLGGCALIADDLRLRQILVNLVGNAIKFTHVGGVLIEAVVRSPSDTETEAELHLMVSDTGIGISESQQARIFDAFSQADNSTTRRYGGSGLGLAISRQLATLMNGKIWLDSQSGKGSRFSFVLPVRLGRTDKQSAVPPDLHGKWVLMAIQNPVLAAGVEAFLQGSGMECRRADNGLSAVRLMEDHKPRNVDLLILDERILDHQASDLFDKIDLRATKVVLLANSPKDVLARNVLRIDTILQKPLTRKNTINAVRHLFAQTNSAASALPARQLRQVPFSLAGRRILVVEDNAVNKMVAHGYLAPFGCEVLDADNGVDCLDILRKQPVDLVFMDCQMPIMDGYEATRRIRGGEAGAVGVPIIAMTANAAASDRDRCLEVGMNGFIGKPITINSMTQILQTWLVADTAPQNASRTGNAKLK